MKHKLFNLISILLLCNLVLLSAEDIGGSYPYVIRFSVSGSIENTITAKYIDEAGNQSNVGDQAVAIPPLVSNRDILTFQLTSNQYGQTQYTYTLFWKSLKHQTLEKYIPYTMVIRQASATLETIAGSPSEPTKAHSSSSIKVTTDTTGTGAKSYEICTLALVLDNDALAGALSGYYKDDLVITQVSK